MTKVILDEKVVDYLNELVEILYEENYFGLKSSAYDYVEWIFDSIEHDIATQPYKTAPTYFSKYGKNLYYSIFKRNNNTEWYVFFNLDENVFYVRYIGNNHTCAQYIK